MVHPQQCYAIFQGMLCLFWRMVHIFLAHHAFSWYQLGFFFFLVKFKRRIGMYGKSKNNYVFLCQLRISLYYLLFLWCQLCIFFYNKFFLSPIFLKVCTIAFSMKYQRLNFLGFNTIIKPVKSNAEIHIQTIKPTYEFFFWVCESQYCQLQLVGFELQSNPWEHMPTTLNNLTSNSVI